MTTELKSALTAASVAVGTIVMPTTQNLRREYARAVALQNWADLCEYSFSDGAKIAMKALGQVAGIAKGHDPRTTQRLLREADLSKVPTQLSVNMQKELKALQDRFVKGEIGEAAKEERRAKIHANYAMAEHYWGAFNLDRFLGSVSIIATNMNTLAVVISGKGAKGAQSQRTLDEALQNIFGYSVSLKDVWNSIKLGLIVR